MQLNISKSIISYNLFKSSRLPEFKSHFLLLTEWAKTEFRPDISGLNADLSGARHTKYGEGFIVSISRKVMSVKPDCLAS